MLFILFFTILIVNISHCFMDPKLNHIEHNEELDANKNVQDDNQNFNAQVEEFFDLHYCDDEYDDCCGDVILFI
jgi:hypothetical protein